MTYGMMLEALACPTRRAVFERLLQGSASVGELASRMPVSRPAVSQHLRVLRDAGLVREQREGVRRIHSLNHDGLAELRSYFDRFWDEALVGFECSIEEGEGE